MLFTYVGISYLFLCNPSIIPFFIGETFSASSSAFLLFLWGVSSPKVATLVKKLESIVIFIY